MKVDLIRIQEWGNDIIAAGTEPPWVEFQVRKLVEAIDSLLDEGSVRLTAQGQADRGEFDAPLLLSEMVPSPLAESPVRLRLKPRRTASYLALKTANVAKQVPVSGVELTGPAVVPEGCAQEANHLVASRPGRIGVRSAGVE